MPDPCRALAAASEPYRPEEGVVDLDALTGEDAEEDDDG